VHGTALAGDWGKRADGTSARPGMTGNRGR